MSSDEAKVVTAEPDESQKEAVGQEKKEEVLDQPVVDDAPTKPKYDDRHSYENAEINLRGVTEKDYVPSENMIALPTGTFKILKALKDTLEKLDFKTYEKENGESAVFTLGKTIVSDRTTYPEETFLKSLEEDSEAFVNIVKYADKDLYIKPVNINVNGGKVSGNAAISMFTSALGIGQVVRIPLYHSGFTLTIKPAKQTSQINLQRAIAAEQIALGRTTNTIIYSNDSAIVTKFFMDFVIEHLVEHTLALPANENIRDYISIHDLPVIAVGVLKANYPSGLEITKQCVNFTKINEAGNPTCSFSAIGKVDISKLLVIDRRKLSKTMLETLCKRQPRSVSIDEVKEYQAQVKTLADKKVTIKSGNGSTVVFTFTNPNINTYITNGEKWVQNIISKTEEIFTDADSIEIKNNKVYDVLTAVVMGIYNVFVSTIELDGAIIEDRPTINEMLDTMSSDIGLGNIFFEEVKKYISASPIALAATPSFICPSCKKDQTEENPAGPMKEFIPLDMLTLFFDQSAFRVRQILTRQMS